MGEGGPRPLVTKGDIFFEWPPRNTLSIKTRFQIEFNIDFDLRIDIRNSRSYDSDRRA